MNVWLPMISFLFFHVNEKKKKKQNNEYGNGDTTGK